MYIDRPQNADGSALLILTCRMWALFAGFPCWRVPPGGTGSEGLMRCVSGRSTTPVPGPSVTCRTSLYRLPGEAGKNPPSPHGMCACTTEPSERWNVVYTFSNDWTSYVPAGRSDSDTNGYPYTP